MSCFTSESQLRWFHVSEEKLNIISFIRIGKSRRSFKSKLMNKLLGFSHSCFFNRDCSGSSKTRLLYDGTIEMNWYLPGGPNDKLFENSLTFLNLRGNAFEFKQQLTFICEVSTMVGIILSYNDIIAEDREIQELVALTTSYSDKICFIFTDDVSDNQEMNNIGNFLMQLTNFILTASNVIISGNLEERAVAIRTNIKHTFSQSISSIKLSITDFSKICKDKNLGIIFEDEIVELGIESCKYRFRSFYKSSLSAALSKLSLEEYLPLQHEGWKKYTQADRRQCKLRIENYIFNKPRGFYVKKFELTDARKFQLNHLFGKISQNEIALKDFKCLIYNKQNPEDALIMLTLLRIKLEKRNLYFADSKIINIQHFIREVGQYYELCCDFGDKALNSTRQLVELDPIVLPQLFARLMLLGEPLEIFDGKAQHIPLTWVQDVLSALADEMGHDKKVFVLGVLGIQSSGKSTLLNTMFGLKFPVASAATGRCTRGISMQLISVDSQYAHVLNYDYLVILDSEGLRAMEDSNQDLKSRDNEFTTHMISDLCIINIMGENFMEWQDIFQTIIIALIKLTSSTSSKPKCLFVHQNISDPNTEENLKEGYQKFLLKLDGVTQFISTETKNNPVYTKFTDIIEFDINETIYYLPSLYSSPPPMSIVSKDYVNSVQNLKKDVISKYGHKTRAITFLDWSVKLKTVWKSILKEDFSSYREIIERIYYSEFENALHKWSQNYACEMEKELLLCKDQILNANYEDAMKNFEVYEAEIEEKCKTILVSDEEEFKQYYFVTHNERLIFNNWKTQAQQHFKNTRLDYQIKTKEKLLFLFEIAQRKHKFFNDFCGNRNKILKNATKTKFKLLSDKTKVRDKKEFCGQIYENEWQNWNSDLKLSENEITNVNVISLLRNEIYSLTSSLQIENKEIEKIKSFYQRFEENNNFLDVFVIGENHYRMFELDHKEIHNPHKYSCWLDYALREEEIVSVTDFLENILLIKKVIDLIVTISEACDDYIKEIINQEVSCEYFAHIIKIIMNSVQEFNNKEKNDETIEIRVQIEKVFIYELALFLCAKLILKFKNKHIVCRDQEMFEEYFEYEWQNWISDLNLLEHEIPCVNFILLLKKEIDTLTSNFEIKNEEMSRIKSFYKRLEQIIYSLDVFIVGEKHYRKFDKYNNEIHSSHKYSCWLDYVLREEKKMVSDTDISEDAPIIIINLIMNIYKECDDYFNEIMNLKFSCVYFVRINRIIMNKVQEFNNNKKKTIITCKKKTIIACKTISISNAIEIRFQIEKVFIYELTLFLCAKLIIMSKNKHKPNQTDSLKMQLKCQFEHYYNKENYSLSLACANGLANVLLEKMTLHVAEEIQFLLIDDFSNFSKFSVSSKCHLQTKVLTDLANESSFNKYWKYIHEPNQAMNDWIIEQFQQFYEHESSSSRINAWYKESICKHISSYKEALQQSLQLTLPVNEFTLSDVVLENSTINIDWKAQLHKKLEGEHTRQFKLSDLDVLLIEPHEITNSSEFVSFFADSLQKQSDGYNFTSWVDTYLMADMLTTFSDTICQNLLFSCDEHCPLCNEPCLSNINSSEHKHYCGSFYRPLGLNGWIKLDSEEFIDHDCTNLKNKDESTYMHKNLKFDLCKQMIDSWDNSSKHYMIESVYWEWVMCNFKDELANHYQYKINDKAIQAWSNLSKSQVLNNLQLQMNDFLSPAWRMKK